jgi:DeoR family fructose operon transcriptional repressor
MVFPLLNGLSAAGEKEASVSLAMAANARKVYLICDSSKLEKDRYFSLPLSRLVHTLITDKNAPKELLDRYAAAGLEVIN